MLKKIINPILFLPLTLCINTLNVNSNESKDYIDNVQEETTNNYFISYE